MKKFIKSLELRWSDLFLLIGFLPFTLFLIFGQEFMQYQDPAMVAFPLAGIIACFVISILGWGTYLYLEHKRGNVKFNIIPIVLIFIVLIGVIAIAIQPSSFTQSVVCRKVNDYNSTLYPGIAIGDTINVLINVSTIHKVFFAMDLTLITLFVYIGLFIFPKRFKSIEFIRYLSIIVFIFMGVVILYSYIAEHDKYIPFLKALFSGDMDNLYPNTMKSFIIDRNAYGMAMLMGIIFAFINHSFDKKPYNYVLMGFFFVNMIFSFSKASLLIAAILIVVYVYFRLIYDYKNHQKRNRNLLIIYSSLIVFGGLLIVISLISKGKFLSPIYNIIAGTKENGTLTMRSYIWDNCYQLLSGGYWVIGRGFGLINLMLFPMNDVNGDHVFPTHSSFVNMVSEGGIFYLLALLALYVYAAIRIAKVFKKNPNLVLAMTLGVLAFFIYSFIETIHYLLYVFLLPPFIFYEVEKQKEATKELLVEQRGC